MKNYILTITLESDVLIGSGEGFGAIIDTDVVLDDLGFPYIPARRIRGCLRDAANEVIGMAGVREFLDISGTDFIEKTLGKAGNEKSAPIVFDNLYPRDYELNHQWVAYLKGKSNLLSMEDIIALYTATRQQTKIDKQGIAEDNSLRTIRVIKKGNVFEGNLQINAEAADEAETLDRVIALACAGLRRIGTKRNRGFGEIQCELRELQHDVKTRVLSELEKHLCTN